MRCRRRTAIGVLLVCLLVSSVSGFAEDVERRDPLRKRDFTLLQRVIHALVKAFSPTTSGDTLSPPRP